MDSQVSVQSGALNSIKPEAEMRLSVRLRNETRTEHTLVESASGLPNAIDSMEAYKSCLLNFYGIFCPLERYLATFSEWEDVNLSMLSRSRTPALRRDLQALNVDPRLWIEAPAHSLPSLPHFCCALGALYVLEGSTLGGQIIMSAIHQNFPTTAKIPEGFFAGRAEQTGPLWYQFRTVIDAYGQQFPEEQECVIEGAQGTFNAISAWFNKNNNREIS